MSKLKYIIIPLILVSLILVGAMCEEESSRKKRSKKEEDKYEDYLTFENEKWGFEIKYPEDWEKQEVDHGLDGFTVGFLTSKGTPEQEITENMVIYASTAEPDDFDELMADMIQEISADPYVNLLEDSKIMISGYPGYKLRYSYKDDYLGTTFQYLHYFINAGDTWYQILYAATDGTYSQYIDQVELMIASFEINK